MGRMVIVILAVGLCVVLCQEKKGPDKLVDKQVTDGQEKQQRVGDKNNNEKDLGENGDKQDGHDQKGKNETEEPIIHSDKVVVVEEENEEGEDTKKKNKNTAEGDDGDTENGDNKTGDVLVDFDVAPKPVKGNETET
eukprot:sb/3474565/